MGTALSDAWTSRVRTYFDLEGVVPRTDAEVERVVPADLLDHEFDTRDHRAPFGVRPVHVREMRAHYDVLAPFYDLILSRRYDVEVRATAWLAALIEGSRPRLAVDAGCGTGLTLGFLAQAFPDVTFHAYDCSRTMVECCATRIERLGLRNVRGPHVAAHRDRKPWIRRGTADLVVTKCAFDASHIAIIDFDAAPSPSLAREHFYRTDPVARHWRMTLRSFAALLKPSGRYATVAPSNEHIEAMIAELGAEVGLEEEEGARTELHADSDECVPISANRFRKRGP